MLQKATQHQLQASQLEQSIIRVTHAPAAKQSLGVI